MIPIKNAKQPVFLVKPYPPPEISEQQTPLPEAYKYNWEPVSLKILAYYLEMAFPGLLDIRIWHLMHKSEEKFFLECVQSLHPLFIAFTELDILINSVNHLAGEIKHCAPGTKTIVGGKHSSLLRTGDHIPFVNIDYIIGGDGILSLVLLVRALLEHSHPRDNPGLVEWDNRGIVIKDSRDAVRYDITKIDGKILRSFSVTKHTMDEYIEKHQKHPALTGNAPVRTVPLFTGNGCSYDCYFCQSPRDFGEQSSRIILRPVEDIADEVQWFVREYRVNNFFSTEPNLNLSHLLLIYKCLEKRRCSPVAFSGFIRAADIVKAHNNGILEELRFHGTRFLSIGLDVSFTDHEDVYNKEYTYSELMECLGICRELGILLLATFVGDPAQDRKSFSAQLEIIKGLAIADMDIRLAIALRHTAYYEQVKDYLVPNPYTAGTGVQNSQYFDRQNYRYQTICLPGKITPEQTYSLVKHFYRTFLFSDKHLDYVEEMVNRFPDTIPYFRQQYNRKPPGTGSLSGRGKVLLKILKGKNNAS